MEINTPPKTNQQYYINKREFEELINPPATHKADDENRGTHIRPYLPVRLCDNLILQNVLLSKCINTFAEDIVFNDINLKEEASSGEDIVDFWELNQEELCYQVKDYLSYGFGASEIIYNNENTVAELKQIPADTLYISKEKDQQTGENYYYAVQQVTGKPNVKLRLSHLNYPASADELPEFLKVFAPNSKNKAYGRFAKVIDIRTKFIRAGAEDRNEESQGIFVDIFPLDSIKQTPLRNQLSRFVCMALMYIGSSVGIYEDNSPTYKRLMTYSSSTKANYWLRHILGYMFSFIKYEKWMNIIDCFCKNDKETGYVDDLVGVYKWQPVPKSVFVPPVRGRFEGEDVFLPHEVVFHLENSYGNWQWVPPEDKREQHFIRYIKFD